MIYRWRKLDEVIFTIRTVVKVVLIYSHLQHSKVVVFIAYVCQNHFYHTAECKPVITLKLEDCGSLKDITEFKEKFKLEPRSYDVVTNHIQKTLCWVLC